MTEGSLNIFISYAREDGKALALRLREDLRAAGCSVWLDVSQIQGGESWTVAIEDAIEACDVGVVLLSAAAYHSRFCRAEQMRLLRKGKRIIPLLVQPLAEIPLYLEHLNYLDFSEDALYTARLRDLLSDLNTQRAFGLLSEPAAEAESLARPFRLAKLNRRLSVPEKRDAPSFRRELAKLRRQPWLAGRVWWTYFLFYCADLEAVAEMLKTGYIPPIQTDGRRRDDNTYLYFRPRTPDLWHREGIKPVAKRGRDDIARPVYLLFDLETVLCAPETRFSAGDPWQTRKTFATANAFEELPFEHIYHDGLPRPDTRDEILSARRAQVLVPGGLTLEPLQMIWCRSEAEVETLRAVLPPDARRRCAPLMTGRADFNLFHRRGASVEQAVLEARTVLLRFATPPDPTPMTVRVTCKPQGGGVYRAEWAGTLPDSLTVQAVPDALPVQPYTLTVHLDAVLAYQGEYWPDAGLI
ncbi:MAG: DarT ssDNA thymidine ADP-ribosyltransferase family protein [Anaerolineae bacterium]|jgi:hypothetical protein|nr:DarT ssDNA thymidine ADP-ribosyltransferase family protein [Anaerolineae bacterium]